MKSEIFSRMINPSVLSNLEDMRARFVKGKPFPHIVIDNFLQEKKASELLQALKQEKFEHKESDLFSLNQTADLHATKNECLKSFHLFASSSEFAEFMKKLTGISVEPGALDLAGSLYKSGDYLLCHDDQVEDRKIAYILYLSKGFGEKDGGRLVLFDNFKGKPKSEVVKNMPVWNSLMVFEVSQISFHSVEENMSSKDRYAIGGWLH